MRQPCSLKHKLIILQISLLIQLQLLQQVLQRLLLPYLLLLQLP